MDRLAAFRAASSDRYELSELGSTCKDLVAKAQRVDAGVDKLHAASERISAASVERFAAACSDGTGGLSEARRALDDLREAELPPTSFTERLFSRKPAAARRLQSALVDACVARLEAAASRHLQLRVRAHAELRSSLERQLQLSCPHLDEQTIRNLDEGRMQVLLSEQSMGRSSASALVGKSATLRALETRVEELRAVVLSFSEILGTQQQQIERADDYIQVGGSSVEEAKKHLYKAVQYDKRYRWAVLVIVLVIVGILWATGWLPIGRFFSWLFGLFGSSAAPIENPPATPSANAVVHAAPGPDFARRETVLSERAGVAWAQSQAEPRASPPVPRASLLSRGEPGVRAWSGLRAHWSGAGFISRVS